MSNSNFEITNFSVDKDSQELISIEVNGKTFNGESPTPPVVDDRVKLAIAGTTKAYSQVLNVFFPKTFIANLKLQKSADGETWEDISPSHSMYCSPCTEDNLYFDFISFDASVMTEWKNLRIITDSGVFTLPLTLISSFFNHQSDKPKVGWVEKDE